VHQAHFLRLPSHPRHERGRIAMFRKVAEAHSRRHHVVFPDVYRRANDDQKADDHHNDPDSGAEDDAKQVCNIIFYVQGFVSITCILFVLFIR